MEDNSKSSTSSIYSDNFIMSWLPNCEEMIQQTTNNKNILYYPFTTVNDKYKVFDVISQRANIDGEDDFVAIDKAAVVSGTSKQKSKQQVKKTVNVTKKPTQNLKQTSTNQYPAKLKVPQTIQLQADWKIISDFNKQSLEKLRFEGDVEVEDKLFCGNLHKISEDYERDVINPLNPVTLKRFDNFKFFGNISTLEDEKLKAATDLAHVFITDKILSVIMTCVYNSRPWHLKITKVGESIFVDKMQNSEIDLITVNESSDVMPSEDDKNIDSFKNLAIEATLINEFIKEQIIDTETNYEEEIEVPVESHPFMDESSAASDIERLMYRYRIWRVGDIDVLVRCQVHAFDENEKGDNIFVNIYALNEYDVNLILY